MNPPSLRAAVMEVLEELRADELERLKELRESGGANSFAGGMSEGTLDTLKILWPWGEALADVAEALRAQAELRYIDGPRAKMRTEALDRLRAQLGMGGENG